jgi:hypothetical protein
MEIKFIAQSDHVATVREKPQPASKFIPEWWKETPPYGGSDRLLLNPQPNVTVKRCIPTLDALISGYIFPLWADCQVLPTESGSKVTWNTEADVFGVWSQHQVSNFEFSDGYDKQVFKYYHGWSITTPKGWSVLITHPYGYKNLPFQVITGIVDTDTYDGEINTPIIFKEGWEGVLEVGTPMFQIIPIKREDWESSYSKRTAEENFYLVEKLRTKIGGYYKKTHRSLKSYK